MRRAISTLFVFLILACDSSMVNARDASPDALASRAELALLDGRLQEAERAYRSLLDRVDNGTSADQELVKTLSGLGISLVLQEKAGEARAFFDRTLRILNHSGESWPEAEAQALHGLAREALLESETDRARSYLEHEFELRLGSAQNEPLALARTLRELGRLLEAERRRAWAEFELQLYELARTNGQLEIPESLEQVDRDAERAIDSLRIHVLRAAALSSESWPNEALLADALRGIGRSYSRAGDSTEGLRWFERAWSVRPPAEFVRGYESYGAYPNSKALVFALDASGRWTYGFFTGEPSQKQAVDAALEQCRRRLPWYELDANCTIYALNDEIVWAPAETGSTDRP
jgi:tetratricopeptide (TPR) repeat protein